MLQTASYPRELSQKQLMDKKHPFYLELFGETQPLIDTKYAEVLPAGSIDIIQQNVESVPIYQYWWTLGYCEGLKPSENLPLIHWLHKSDTFVTISLYFPISGGWRIKELLPTIRDLKPFHEQLSMWHEAGKIWNDIAPLFIGVASLPLRVNPLTGIPLALLPSLSKLHINTVQPEKDFAWSVDKVSFQQPPYGLMQGVRWNIPYKLFHKLGRRLTGSLAVCFIPSQVQSKAEDINNPPQFTRQPILAQAVVNLKHHHPHYLPEQKDTPPFVELYIHPTPYIQEKRSVETTPS
jgi:hypothetical protein